MNFYKKLGEIRPNQLITTYGPGSIMDAVNDSLTVEKRIFQLCHFHTTMCVQREHVNSYLI